MTVTGSIPGIVESKPNEVTGGLPGVRGSKQRERGGQVGSKTTDYLENCYLV